MLLENLHLSPIHSILARCGAIVPGLMLTGCSCLG
jgi:hypothetical protein